MSETNSEAITLLQAAVEHCRTSGCSGNWQKCPGFGHGDMGHALDALATVTAERDAVKAVARRHGIHKWSDGYVCEECAGGWEEGEPEYHVLPCVLAIDTEGKAHGG